MMSFSIDHNTHSNYMHIDCDGVFDFKIAIEVFDAISEKGKFSCPNRLWDLRNCTVDMSMEQLRSIAEISLSRDAARGRGAFLIDNETDYGLMRMIQTFRSNGELNMEIFDDIDMALAWLA